MASERATIQGIVDRLADLLGRPTAVDDPSFQLLFHSPQRGPLDDVRIRSILDRDAPSDAKEWVRAQGVAEAVGVQRLDGAPHVGMLPRAFAPIRHDGRLLGYLWVIDPDGTLGTSHDDHVAQAVRELAPLLYRRRARDVLDRRHRRAAVLDLLDESGTVRETAARRLRDGHAVRAAGEVAALVAEIVVPVGGGYSTAELVALETGLERARARSATVDLVHVTEGPRAFVVVSGPVGSTQDVPQLAARLQALLSSTVRPHRVVVGIGSTRRDLVDVHESHTEAAVVTRVLTRVPGEGDVAHHDDLGAYGVVARLPAVELRPGLMPASFRRLIAADEPDLVATLESFLDEGGDVVATAARLHLHRSSVYGRLRRIEARTGRSLGDGRARLELHVGLAVARFLGLWPRPDVGG